MLCLYCTTAIVDSVTMSDITTISSMIVNPAADRNLPVTIFRPIQRGAGKRGAHVEDVLATPMGGVLIVLVRSQCPLGAFRHRIDWNPAQELQLASRGVVRNSDSLNQRIEIRRVPFDARLDLER